MSSKLPVQVAFAQRWDPMPPHGRDKPTSAPTISFLSIRARRGTRPIPQFQPASIPSKQPNNQIQSNLGAKPQPESSKPATPPQSILERDAMLARNLGELDGGISGVEVENGEVKGLKNSVARNMFRVI